MCVCVCREGKGRKARAEPQVHQVSVVFVVSHALPLFATLCKGGEDVVGDVKVAHGSQLPADVALCEPHCMCVCGWVRSRR